MTNTIIELAKTLTINHSKKELASLARGFGWKGDDARTPILQLALYVATKMGVDSEPSPTDSSQDEPSPTDSSQDEQQAPADSSQDEQQAPADSSQDEQQDNGEDETAPLDNNKQFEQLLKQSNIAHPHKLLQKVWLLATKAKQNVLLVGPAGSGKTMLSQQLSQLIGCQFGSVSVTMGMSESHLSGWLLPIGKKGKFDYMPSPFVNCIQNPSVFLLDELDAGDSNVLLMLNSIMSNGFITIPHKLDNPTITRHADSIIIAGANGNGEEYMRNQLDGATLDRFYQVTVDYDKDYISSLFGNKTKRKSPKWQSVVNDNIQMDLAREFYETTAIKLKKSKLTKIWGTRVAQRMTSALSAGIPLEEIKQDLFTDYSMDEKARLS